MIHSIALSALAQASHTLDRAAENMRQASAPAPGPADQVDLSEAAVQLLVAQRAFEAALKLAGAADETAEATIDLLA